MRALKAAIAEARLDALRFATPLIRMRDGKIVKVWPRWSKKDERDRRNAIRKKSGRDRFIALAWSTYGRMSD